VLISWVAYAVFHAFWCLGGKKRGKMGDLAVFIATYVLLFQKLCVDLHDILFFKLLSQFIV